MAQFLQITARANPCSRHLWGTLARAVNCTKVTYTVTVFPFRFPMPHIPLPEHKNADFVLEKPENEGFEGQKSTKTSILCSKCPKTGVPKAKKAQKSRFCARNARKRGSRRQKKHKNLDFVLEMPENGGSEGKKRTKTPILCSKDPKTGVPKPKSAQKCRFCAREGAGFRFGLF